MNGSDFMKNTRASIASGKSGGSGSPGRPVEVTPGGDTTISTRKIENGFVTRTDTYGPDSGYKSEEVFSKTPPIVTVKAG